MWSVTYRCERAKSLLLPRPDPRNLFGRAAGKPHRHQRPIQVATSPPSGEVEPMPSTASKITTLLVDAQEGARLVERDRLDRRWRQ
jgi:hypothetical protein